MAIEIVTVYCKKCPRVFRASWENVQPQMPCICPKCKVTMHVTRPQGLKSLSKPVKKPLRES